MKKLGIALIGLAITAALVVGMHEIFFRHMELSPNAGSILGMEFLAVTAFIAAFTLGHILKAVKILTAESDETLEIGFLDILKILFLVFASGCIYLGLMSLFKPK
jgi:Phr family secreted Rap phosphatase inhibitor